jgi:hypothetical protein
MHDTKSFAAISDRNVRFERDIETMKLDFEDKNERVMLFLETSCEFRDAVFSRNQQLLESQALYSHDGLQGTVSTEGQLHEKISSYRWICPK